MPTITRGYARGVKELTAGWCGWAGRKRFVTILSQNGGKGDVSYEALRRNKLSRTNKNEWHGTITTCTSTGLSGAVGGEINESVRTGARSEQSNQTKKQTCANSETQEQKRTAAE